MKDLFELFDRVSSLETIQVPVQLLTFHNYDSLSAGISAAGSPLIAVINRNLLIRRFDISAYVATTNNGSNYWTFSLKKADGTTITTLNTSAISANTWSLISGTGLSASVTSSTIAVMVAVSKTGSPGNLNLSALVECIRN